MRVVEVDVGSEEVGTWLIEVPGMSLFALDVASCLRRGSCVLVSFVDDASLHVDVFFWVEYARYTRMAHARGW